MKSAVRLTFSFFVLHIQFPFAFPRLRAPVGESRFWGSYGAVLVVPILNLRFNSFCFFGQFPPSLQQDSTIIIPLCFGYLVLSN